MGVSKTDYEVKQEIVQQQKIVAQEKEFERIDRFAQQAHMEKLLNDDIYGENENEDNSGNDSDDE